MDLVIYAYQGIFLHTCNCSENGSCVLDRSREHSHSVLPFADKIGAMSGGEPNCRLDADNCGSLSRGA